MVDRDRARLSDPDLRAQLLAFSEHSWMNTYRRFFEIAPAQTPDKSLRGHVKERIHWVRTPNRHSVGRVSELPRQLAEAALAHLSAEGLIEYQTLPTEELGWTTVLDATARYLGEDYAKFCRLSAPPDLRWPTPETPNLSDQQVSEPTKVTSESPSMAAGNSPLTPPPISSSELGELFDRLRLTGIELTEAIAEIGRLVEQTQPISREMTILITSWNTLLSDLASGLNGDRESLSGFDRLAEEIARVRDQEDSKIAAAAALTDSKAKLGRFQAQRTDGLYQDDFDFRDLVESKITALEHEIAELEAAMREARSTPVDATEVFGPLVEPGPAPATPVPETGPAFADAEKGQIANDAVWPSNPTDEHTRSSGDGLPTATQKNLSNQADAVNTPDCSLDASVGQTAPPPDQSQTTGSLTPTVDETTQELSEGADPAITPDDEESAIAGLIVRDKWAEACALTAVTSFESTMTSALTFCAEAFCLPVIGTDPHELIGRYAVEISEAQESMGQPAVLVGIGLLRTGLQYGREHSWLLTDDILDAMPGPWREISRELRQAVSQGYRHHRDHASAAGSGAILAALKHQALEFRETLPKRGNRFQRAAEVLRRMMSAGGELALALDAVTQWVDGTGDINSLREHLNSLEDPRKLVDRVDASMSEPRQRRAPIVASAYESLAAKIVDVADLLRRTIAAAETRSDGYTPVAGAIEDSVRTLVADLPDVDSDGTISTAALNRFEEWLRSGTSPGYYPGRSFGQLRVLASLPAVSAVRDEKLNLPSSKSVSVVVLTEQLLHPRPRHDLFRAYLDRGNLAAATELRDEGDGSVLEIRTRQRDWRHVIDSRRVDLHAELLRLQAQTQVSPEQRARIDGQISALNTLSDERFDVALSRADGIANQLEQLWKSTRQELGSALRELDVNVGLTAGDQLRIQSLIDQNDFITAREFMALAANLDGEPLPPDRDDGLVSLREFRAMEEDWPSDDSTPLEVVRESNNAEPPERVIAALKAWKQGCRARRPSEWQRHILHVLDLIGLDRIAGSSVSDRTERGQNQYAKFSIKATPVGGSYVAALGTRARRTGYNIYVVDQGASVDRVFEKIPSGERREANLIFHPGVLSWDTRKTLRASADKKKVTALVIDSVVIAYIAMQPEQTFKMLQRVTLPFSIFAHWAPRVAGDVPDELFVGRVDAIDRIVSRDGSIFVYGGRQLGKSALLHRIERDFNRLENRLALYIDFKVERIGEENEPEHIWTVLRNRLQEKAVIPAANTSTKVEAITKAIREWLDSNPERRVLLLCDETDAFLQNEARERITNNRAVSFPNVAALKGLMDDTQRRFKPVFAGLHQVQRIAGTPNSPLAHGGEDILVGPLQPSEAWDLVVRPFKALGFEFESVDLVWRLLAFTNHHAGLVQIVCDELYKEMRSRDPLPGEPPYIIRTRDIDSVITSKKIRDFIAERFRLTIQLEDRYFVIAMVVALLGLDSGFENRYGKGEILDYCRLYWPGGFETLTEAELSVYLDELKDLGVLVPGSDTSHYGMRSPNVVHMLGDRETIEKQLEDGRFDLPLQYNAQVSRRRLSAMKGPEKYSPLSEYELSRVMPKRIATRQQYAVAVVGSQALGIDDVSELLVAAGKEGYEYEVQLVPAAESKALVMAGTGIIANRPLVVCDSVDHPELLREAIDRIEAASASRIGRRALLLGSFGAAAAGELRSRGVEVVSLKLWTTETLRAVIDNPVTDPRQRDELIAATGGWPKLCEYYLNEIRTGTPVVDAIKLAHGFPSSQEHAAAFLTAAGVTAKADLALLGQWAAISGAGEVTDDGTLSELLEVDVEHIAEFLARLSVLCLVSPHAEGHVLNGLVRRALNAVGAADVE